jgi:hypothetical protein
VPVFSEIRIAKVIPAANYAFSYALYNEPLDTISKMSLIYKSITKENLKYIVNKLINGKYYQVIMYPHPRDLFAEPSCLENQLKRLAITIN